MDHDSDIQHFMMSVTGMYRRDAMLRHVSEAVGTRVELYSIAEI